MTAAPPPARFADVRTQLFVLALANFAIGFGAFVVVAILPALAAGLGVSDAGAGLTMTSYAIAYGIGSPLGVALTSRFERRNVIVCGLAVFGVGALLCALAPSLSMLLIAARARAI
ncbi:MAG: MFS transporter, partial [Pseudomonadota bacterium]